MGPHREGELLATVRGLGIGFVAYSPLGRGFLTCQFRKPEDLPGDDARGNMPRFQVENFQRNVELVAKIEKIARAKNCTLAQLALAWVLSNGKDIVPIPGTKRRRYLDQNLGALDIRLTAADQAALDDVIPPGAPPGSATTRWDADAEFLGRLTLSASKKEEAARRWPR